MDKSSRPKMCKVRVWHERGFDSGCCHPAKPGTDLCGVHSPEAVARRQAKSDARDAERRRIEGLRCSGQSERDRKLALLPDLLDAVHALVAATPLADVSSRQGVALQDVALMLDKMRGEQ